MYTQNCLSDLSTWWHRPFCSVDFADIPPVPVVRVSVANLVASVNGNVIGLLNKWSLKRGNRVVSCIGWAAVLYDHGVLERLGAFAFEWADARFLLPRDALDVAVWMLGSDQGGLLERSVLREAEEEWTQEMTDEQKEPIMSSETMGRTEEWYMRTAYHCGYGTKEIQAIPTVYIWRYFSLRVSDTCMRILQSSPVVYRVDESEALRGETRDGTKIGPNMSYVYAA